MEKFTTEVLEIIKRIPYGKVMTYGQIAFNAGNPFGARQVARILHSMSKKEKLPWHRVINAKGKISLGGELGIIQKSMLIDEDVEFKNNKINLRKYSFFLEEVKDEN
ncbi:MAG: MGMT family protein [Tenericutes bacterium]|jgi:methylated-DNA-protein-cysteine methyltransferase-like protein|nr:MGMT family protein [Mycoplasmatota bacterium]